jgi:hypothetical protein
MELHLLDLGLLHWSDPTLDKWEVKYMEVCHFGHFYNWKAKYYFKSNTHMGWCFHRLQSFVGDLANVHLWDSVLPPSLTNPIFM